MSIHETTKAGLSSAEQCLPVWPDRDEAPRTQLTVYNLEPFFQETEAAGSRATLILGCKVIADGATKTLRQVIGQRLVLGRSSIRTRQKRFATGTDGPRPCTYTVAWQLALEHG